MKCPKCNSDGAYQPLMRELECANPSCSYYVAPKITNEGPSGPVTVHGADHDVDLVQRFKNGMTGDILCPDEPQEFIMIPKNLFRNCWMNNITVESNHMTMYQDIRFEIRGTFSRQDIENLMEVKRKITELFPPF